jgi:hypothetical protein
MTATTREQMQIAIDRYFAAWKTQNPELLSEVFTQDAIYRAQPFDIQEYHGLDAIKNYWHTKPVESQTSPRPTVISQAFGENYCFIEWETTFTTHTNSQKTVRGMMRLEFDKELVRELREHYASKEIEL